MAPKPPQIYQPPNPTDILYDFTTPLRVFAYCRVSTDDKDQINSAEMQQKYFDSLRAKHKNWISFELFSDKGISGTSLKNRTDFLKMINLAKSGQVDLIITKDVSRFSRNIIDALSIVKELKKYNVAVYFLAQGLNSLNENDYEKLSAFVVKAENESRSTSKRVKFGHQMKMQMGVTFGRREMLGYRIEKNEKDEQYYKIIEDEAEIVRKIYEWFANGDGTHVIARRLEANGIKTARYRKGWSNTVILRILRNEKYAGHLLQGKTYTPDAMSHEKKYNRGQSFQCLIEDHHEPIVDKDLWNKVQNILKDKEPPEEQKIKHSNRYWLSGKVFCGVCGGRFISCTKKKKTTTYKAWVCFEANARGRYKETEINGEVIAHGCNSGGMINDRLLKMAVHDILEEIIEPHKEQLITLIMKAYRQKHKTPKPQKAFDVAQTKKHIDETQEAIDRLLNLYTKGKIEEDDYSRQYAILKNEKKELLETINEEKVIKEIKINEKAVEDTLRERIKYLCDLKDSDFNDEELGRITEKIIVYPEHIIEIHLVDINWVFFLHFKAKGKLDKYEVEFTAYNRDEAMAIIGDKITNRPGAKKVFKSKTTKED